MLADSWLILVILRGATCWWVAWCVCLLGGVGDWCARECGFALAWAWCCDLAGGWGWCLVDLHVLSGFEFVFALVVLCWVVIAVFGFVSYCRRFCWLRCGLIHLVGFLALVGWFDFLDFACLNWIWWVLVTAVILDFGVYLEFGFSCGVGII